MTEKEDFIAKELSEKAIPILMEYPELFLITKMATERANPIDSNSHIYWQIEELSMIVCREVAHHIAFFCSIHIEDNLLDRLMKVGLFLVIQSFLPPPFSIDTKQWGELCQKYDFNNSP